MITKPWSPPPAEAAMPSAGGSLPATESYEFTDNRGMPHSLRFCSMLFVVITSLRTKLPCVVALEGTELFSFDGTNPPVQTPEFAAVLTNFESCMLEDRRQGYEEALDWMNSRMAAADDAATAAAASAALPIQGSARAEAPSPEPEVPGERLSLEEARSEGYPRAENGERAGAGSDGRRHAPPNRRRG